MNDSNRNRYENELKIYTGFLATWDKFSKTSQFFYNHKIHVPTQLEFSKILPPILLPLEL